MLGGADFVGPGLRGAGQGDKGGQVKVWKDLQAQYSTSNPRRGLLGGTFKEGVARGFDVELLLQGRHRGTHAVGFIETIWALAGLVVRHLCRNSISSSSKNRIPSRPYSIRGTADPATGERAV